MTSQLLAYSLLTLSVALIIKTWQFMAFRIIKPVSLVYLYFVGPHHSALKLVYSEVLLLQCLILDVGLLELAHNPVVKLELNRFQVVHVVVSRRSVD